VCVLKPPQNGVCAESSVVHLAQEVGDFTAALPPTSELHIGIYFSAYNSCLPPSAKYDDSVLRGALATARVDGVTIYVTEHPTTDCSEPLQDKGCIVKQAFGEERKSYQ